MKTKKLISKMKALLNEESREQTKQHDTLIELLKKLRHRRAKLKEELKHAIKKSDKHEIEEALAILKEQRKKGLELLGSLKNK